DRKPRSARVGAATVTLRGRTHDREAQSRARLPVPAAPEALECSFGFVGCQATALVADGQAGESVFQLDGDRHAPAARAVTAGVLDEVSDRALEGGPVAANSDLRRGGDLDDSVLVRDGGLRQLV